MNKNLRSGIDRRQRHITVPEDWRVSKERRMVLKDPDKTIGRLRMVGIFNGLSSEQLKSLLNICSKRTVSTNDPIYSIGDESKEMFILVRGKLRILYKDGHEQTGIIPPGIVGDIGVFTGVPRSATVTAGIKCTILSFNKEELLRVFSNDTDMWVKIQTNIIKELSGKIREDIKYFDEKTKLRSLEIQ